MMSPFEQHEFLSADSSGEHMTITQTDEVRTRLKFEIGLESVQLDWFQVRDMYGDFNEWLVNNAHLARVN